MGISGIDAGCLVAEKLVGKHGEDWGFVGKVTAGRILAFGRSCWPAGCFPVMACLAVGDDGQIYNINADQAAVACAVRCGPTALIFLTDVDGVRDRRRPDSAADSTLTRSLL